MKRLLTFAVVLGCASATVSAQTAAKPAIYAAPTDDGILVGVATVALWSVGYTLRAQESTGVDLQDAVVKAVSPVPATVVPWEASALQRRGAAPRTGEHKLGVGVRTGGFGLGIGASLRSWFQPPWGFQVGISHYGYGDFFNVSYSSTQITPAVLYEFAPIKVNAPLSLRPFVGGGLSIITSSFPYLNNADTTNTGVLIVGGVELFFAKVPKLGVSGELEFTPSTSPYLSVSSVGGPGFVALGHWYFK